MLARLSHPQFCYVYNALYLYSFVSNCYRVADDAACPKRYQANLTVVGFTADHSGIYTVTIENRAGMITEQFERRVEGWLFISTMMCGNVTIYYMRKSH